MGSGTAWTCLSAIYVFLLAIFLGVELIGRVPATLAHAAHVRHERHPRHRGAGRQWSCWAKPIRGSCKLIGFLAVVLGAANVVGAFVVTDRMLEMFKKKPTAGAEE